MNVHENAASILLVEDSQADVDLLEFCLKKHKLLVNLIVFDNGQDALDYLNQISKKNKNELPDIILLDINLPGMNGIEILQEIKNNEETCFIPTVMLTSSEQDEDIIKSYSNHANCFIQKPIDLHSFQKLIGCFEDFWLTLVKLPSYAKFD